MFVNRWYKIEEAIQLGKTKDKVVGLYQNVNERIADFTELEILSLRNVNQIPKEITQLKKLKVLEIDFLFTEKLPEEIRGLNQIEELHLTHLLKLKELPEWFHEFSNLKKFSIEYCHELRIVKEFENLKKIEELSLIIASDNNLIDISSVLNSLSNTKIEKLRIAGHTKLSNRIWKFTNLRELEIQNFEDELPSEIENLKNLKVFRCIHHWNYKLKSVPEEIGQLQNLEELVLNELPVHKLPDSICKLRKLKKLTLRNLKALKIGANIQNLKNLEELVISNFNKLELPKELWNLIKLEYLHLSAGSFQGNESFLVWETKGMTSLQNLKHLELHGIDNLLTVPIDISKLKSLKYLSLKQLKDAELPDIFTGLQNLEELVIQLTSLKKIPLSFNQLSSIKKVHIESRQEIEIEEGIKFANTLEKLHFSRIAENMGDNLLDAIAHVPRLKELCCIGANLKFRNSLAFEKTLTHLEFTCKEVHPSLNFLENFKKLEDLTIIGSEKIKEVPEVIFKLYSLRCLIITKTHITSIPDNVSSLSRIEEILINLYGSRWEGIPQMQQISNNIIELDKLESLGINIYEYEEVKKLKEKMSKEAQDFLDKKDILYYVIDED